MKVILFLAAIYALIINQCQRKKVAIAYPHTNYNNYTQAATPDTLQISPVTAVYYTNYTTGRPQQGKIPKRFILKTY